MALASVILLAQVASADTYRACWVESRPDPFGTVRQVTVCRLADGGVSEHPGDSPPADLNPAVGSDSNGECWFWTSSETSWVILSTFDDGSAILGIYVNEFLALDTGRIPRCTSEPTIDDPPEDAVREAITEYIHDPPSPDLNPPVGRGLTGMETHLAIPVPAPWADTITIPLYTLDVEVWVGSLGIDWGDGAIDTFPPAAYPELTGYPDGLAIHTYETKTCDPPSTASDCHPTHTAYPLTVTYEWQARWRANGGPWIPISVPTTSTTTDYPVAEAIAQLTNPR